LKILVVIGAYFPAMNFGGPVVSIDNLCRQLQNDIEFYIVTVDHDLNSSERLKGIKEGWNDIGHAKVLYLREKDVNYNNLLTITEKINPDIVYVNSFFYAKFTVPFLRIAKKTGRSLIVAPRGELFDNALNKKYKKLPYTFIMRKLFIRDNVYFHSTSEEETVQLQKFLKIKKDNIFVLQNMAKLSDENESYEIINRQTLKVVYLARIHESKNLLYALDVLSEIPFDVCFNIYGNIEDPDYWSKCKNKIKTLGKNIEVNYVGVAKRDEIQSVFASHHVFLFPTLTENFGHSIAESLLSGCPVITSNKTPWGWIQIEKCGYALPLGKKSVYVNALFEIHSMDDKNYQEMRRKCKSNTINFLKVSELSESYKDVFARVAKNNRGFGSEKLIKI
jgi:glycosyltransferase involved in cell wall biosynthesis